MPNLFIQKVHGRRPCAFFLQHACLREMLQPFQGCGTTQSELKFHVATRDASVTGKENHDFLAQRIFCQVFRPGGGFGMFKASMTLYFLQHGGVRLEVDVAHLDVVTAHLVNGLSFGDIQTHSQREIADVGDVEPVALFLFVNHGFAQS